MIFYLQRINIQSNYAIMIPIDLFLNDAKTYYSYSRKYYAYRQLIQYGSLDYRTVCELLDDLKCYLYSYDFEQYSSPSKAGLSQRTIRYVLRQTSQHYPKLFTAILLALQDNLKPEELLYMVEMSPPNLCTHENKRRKIGYPIFLSSDDLAYYHNIYVLDKNANDLKYYLEKDNYTFDVVPLILPKVELCDSIYCKLYKYYKFDIDSLPLSEEHKELIKLVPSSGCFTKPAIKK